MRCSNPQIDILESDSWVNLFLAGYGSGKSFLLGIKAAMFAREYPHIYGFIASNFYDQLDKATLAKVKEAWFQMGIMEYSKENPYGIYTSGVKPPPHFNTKHHRFESYHNVVTFINGHTIFTGSLDNAKAHDGKEFGYAMLDETKDSREEDVKTIILSRLRQKGIVINGKPVCPMYIVTSPAKSDWINAWFDLDKYIDEINAKIYSKTDYFKHRTPEKFVNISSTYHNQNNLPAGYIENMLKNNTDEKGKSMVYANPFATTGGEFYSSFSRFDHVKPNTYIPSKPLHISFDQNVVPYTPALISQVEKDGDTWVVKCINEICLKNPRNTTEDVCEEILRQYGDCEGIYFYGDASGKNRNGLTKDTRDHYQLISRLLARKTFNGSNRVLRSNPALIKRREFINKIFENKLPIRIEIDPKCVNLLADLTYIKQDIDGSKKKDIYTDPDTKEKYQKYGHLSDCLDYQLVAMFNGYYNN